MRKLSYLLTVVRDLLPANIREWGLCHVVTQLYLDNIINYYELLEIRHYFDENKPNEQHSRVYWWKPGEIEPRIKWLNEHIEKLKSEQL